MKYFIALVSIFVFAQSAFGAEATCRDYARVKNEDRSLFNGYIYGYVMAKLGDRGQIEVNTASARVKQLADKFCPDHPNDRLMEAIASFTKVVSQYGSNGQSVQSFWDIHKECEELALKLAYPRKLNECNTEECKRMAESWINDAVNMKRDCLQKKAGQ